MVTVFLGVDGGNTKTIALIADADGHILGAGRSGCSDIYGAASPQIAVQEIVRAVEAALAAAGRGREEILNACFSLAGADWQEDYAYLYANLETYQFGREIEIYNDAFGGLRAGVPDGVGVIIVCGTGTATAARNAKGDFWHVSFWQESLGGRELGQLALRAVYRSELGIEPPTSLTAPILALYRQPNVESLLHLLTKNDRSVPVGIDCSRISPIILTEAVKGDNAARAVVDEHARLLVEYALAAARKVGLDGTPFTLVLNGGVFRHEGRAMLDAVAARVAQRAPGVKLVRSRHEPVIGALLQAFDTSGYAITPDLIERLDRTMPPRSLFSTID